MSPDDANAAPIEREIRIAAPPERVFAYFTDPRKMERWMGLRVSLDPTPGGIYRADLNGRDITRGEFVEVVPYSRVAFTFGWEGEGHPVPPGSSTVEVSFVPDGDATIVRLVHRGLPADMRAIHTDGWTDYLARLVVAAAGDDPGPDPRAAHTS